MAEDIRPGLIADAIGGSGGSTDDIRKRLILAMLQEGTSGAPVQHWAQGLDRVGKALLGGLQLRDLDAADREFRRGEREYNYRRFGIDGDRPAGPAPTGGPRPPGAPPLASLPPMGVDPAPPDVPFRPVAPLTNATPQPDIDTANVAAAGGTTPLVPQAPLQPQMGTMGVGGPQGAVAQALLAQGLGAGQRGAFGQNALPNDQQDPGFAVPPRPSSAMALTTPQQPAGAIPPPLAPPGPPAGGQRPLTPPAPRADQVAQVQPRRAPTREDIDRYLHPRTSAPTRALIGQDLKPEEYDWKVVGDNLIRTSKKAGTHLIVANAEKSPDAVRIAREVLANPQQYGFTGADDPALKEAIQYRISGLQAPTASVRQAADMQTLKEAQEAYSTALRLRPAIESAKQAVLRAPEGVAGQAAAMWGRLAAGTGLPVPEGANEAQLLQSVTTQLASLYKLPGPVANAEMQLYMQAAARLGDTRQANLMKLELFERMQQRSGEIMNILRRHAGKDDLYDHLAKLDTPLFTAEERKALQDAMAAPAGAGGGGAASGPTAGGVQRWERGPDGRLRPVGQ